MSEISLSVTKGVLEYAVGPREQERQIAYAEATADIASRLSEVTARSGVKLRIAGQLTLNVADRGAIWLAHNPGNEKSFDALFAFLAHFPSKRLRFVCELVA